VRKFANLVMLFSLLFVTIPQAISQEKKESSPISGVLEYEASDYVDGIMKDERESASKTEVLKRQMNAFKAFTTGDFYTAYNEFEKVIRDNPKDLQAWFMLAIANSKIENKYDKVRQKKGYLAATNAYELATDPLTKAAALQLLSTLNSDLKAFYDKEVIKLGRKKIEDKLAELTTGYPKVFALYDTEVPEKADVGTACFSFTKSLSKANSVRHEDYISIQPQLKDMSVVAKNNRLCVSGMPFGSSYKVTLKKGLRGEGDYKLAEEQTVDLFIKHRAASIAFRERGYILPSKGPQLIPLKAINVPSVKIEVFRIPVHNLHSAIAQGDFLTQLYSWKVDQLKNEDGEMVAEGTFDCKGSMDQAIVSGLPLDKILGGKLEPGLYVIQAKAIDEPSYRDDAHATQWLVVSDIGLTTFSGPDGLHVNTRSLATAKEMSGVELKVIARNGRNLGSAKTDHHGNAHFDEKMLSGKDSNQPALIQASHEGKDFTFISLRKEGFDFSDRGVEGRDPAKKADAYVYTERGVYRPGETVNLTALLRDQHGKAMPKVPLTFRIFRPDGVEVFTQVTQDAGAGSHTLTLDTQANSYTGQWVAGVYLDPKGAEISRTTFQLDDFVPPRIEVKQVIAQKVIHPLETLEAAVDVRYFYGSVASDLNVEGLVELTEEKEPFEKWKGYRFGLEEETWTPLKFKSESTVTDDKGVAKLQTTITTKPDTTKMLSAKSIATVFEAGGRGRTVTAKTLFWHKPYAIGIQPQFEGENSPDNGHAKFNIIAVDETGALKKQSDLKYTLYEETHGFTWFRSSANWNYEVTIDEKPVGHGTVDLNNKEATALKVDAKFGYYRLEVMDEKTGVATSYRFHAGWGGTSELPDRPDMIEMSLDKETYKPGEKATLSLTSPFDGELAIVAIDESNYHEIHRGKATKKGTRVEIPLDHKILQKAGTYLMATVFRPGDVKSEKTAGRAIGLIWLDAKGSMPKIDLSLDAPKISRPEKEYEVKVCLKKHAKNPHATVAVIDEAVLQLTDFKTPDPFEYFFEQTKLAYVYRDSYGQLINPFGARPGDFKVGGDGSERGALKNLPARTFKTISLISGIITDFTEGEEEDCAQTAKVMFALPEFAGRVRVMAVAWNDEATGSAATETLVREPVETNVALPRFLAPGDQTTLILDVHNLTEADGTFEVSIQGEGELSLLKDFSQTLKLTKDQMVHLPIEINAKNVGIGKLTVHIEGQGISLNKNWEIAVRSAVFEMTHRTSGVLKPGEKVALDSTLMANIKPTTSPAELSIGSMPTFGAERLRKEMRAYPYSCLEQLTSRLSTELYITPDHKDEARTLDIISQMVSLQHFDGPFSLWSVDGSVEPWLSLYAIDLLNKAQVDKYDVGEAVLNRGMGWIKERVRQNSSGSNSAELMPYAHYILAKQGQGSMGSLKYYVDNSQGGITNRVDCALIAGAFALYGDAQAAKVWFDKAIAATALKQGKGEFFETWLSDTAILVTVMAETVQNHPQLHDLAAQLSDMSGKSDYLSTFEKGWLIRASAAMASLGKSFKFTLGNETHGDKKPVMIDITAVQLAAKTELKNVGSGPLSYTLNVTGEPVDPSKVPNNGFDLSRELYTLDGEVVDPAAIKSGDLMIVLIKGELLEADTHQVMVVDLLPSGFEIETVKFSESSLKDKFSWMTELTELSRVEKRDDRFMAAFTLNSKDSFAAAYFVRALNPGTYKYPGAVVESMYRPQFNARTAEKVLTIK
jgi:alpha-2-macroglobulin